MRADTYRNAGQHMSGPTLLRVVLPTREEKSEGGRQLCVTAADADAASKTLEDGNRRLLELDVRTGSLTKQIMFTSPNSTFILPAPFFPTALSLISSHIQSSSLDEPELLSLLRGVLCLPDQVSCALILQRKIIVITQ
ncbi:unnamed protein product [Protopolystoma xenopodis]|uniref:Uncharacterized protein n=1 Tax=Protopolystoma xenopodis TaxID=117903 RepID=A0A3S5ALZ2_9PLAT|nr:unnamed protein product [Protopolystoma xenopodis]